MFQIFFLHKSNNQGVDFVSFFGSKNFFWIKIFFWDQYILRLKFFGTKKFFSLRCTNQKIANCFFKTEKCLKIRKQIFKDGEIDTGTDYFDIFSEKTNKQEIITILIEEKLKNREQILKKHNITR